LVLQFPFLTPFFMAIPSAPSTKSGSTKADAATAAAVASHSRATRWLLGLICFFSGASIMVIEIAANRLLAPSFGNSIYTWTALIGVVLVALSVGGYLGGYLSDKFSRLDLLGALLAGAAILTMFIPALSSVLSPSLSKGGLIAGPVFISLFLFAIPGILLGAVSPASVRFYSMAAKDEHVGVAAGVISMLGSLGSFVGTFLSGFFLLSAFGVKSIFLGSGVVLLLLALLAFWMARKSVKVQLSTVAVTVLAALVSSTAEGTATEPGMTTLHRASSFYHQIEVVERDGAGSKERFLKLDSTMEGGMRMKDGGLVLEYQKFWRLAQLNESLPLKRSLFIGAGAFGMPEELSRLVPSSHVDVAEIDPAVIQTGRQFFKLDEHPTVQAHATDARRFLKDSEGGYDLIFGDAYNGVRHIPAHLVTQEFFAEIKSRLSPKGVFMMNVISAVEGDRAELLEYILTTVRSVFPHVEVFAVGGARVHSQNVVLLASQESWKPWIEDGIHLPGSWQYPLLARRIPQNQLPVGGEDKLMTDDWNPVDAIIARQLLK
jgi:spermidine synthase